MHFSIKLNVEDPPWAVTQGKILKIWIWSQVVLVCCSVLMIRTHLILKPFLVHFSSEMRFHYCASKYDGCFKLMRNGELFEFRQPRRQNLPHVIYGNKFFSARFDNKN